MILLLNTKELPKIEIIKKAAQITGVTVGAGVTVEGIWHELEKLEKSNLGNKNIEKIVEILTSKSSATNKEPTKEVLEELYVNKNMNIKELSKLYRVDKETVKKWLINHGIPLKSLSETISAALLKGKNCQQKKNFLNCISIKTKPS